MELGQLYHGLSVGSYGLSGLSFILAAVLFFRYRIIDIFNELSGRTLKKNMERLSALSGASSEGKDRRREEEAEKTSGATDTLRESTGPGLKRRLVVQSSRWQSGENEQEETELLTHGGGYVETEELDLLISDAGSTEELGELDMDFSLLATEELRGKGITEELPYEP